MTTALVAQYSSDNITVSTPPGSEPRAKLASIPQPPKPAVTVNAELISVDDAIGVLGIGKTKFYDPMKTKQINRVRIGWRTLIKRVELQAFISQQTA